ncbi:MAG: IS91 family transposase, partial [Desulfobacteraceae bacterium]|nr:IS91 family transposase [Desulfobacteraceae bacterium]
MSRYTHRITISNSRIIEYDQHTVTFKWKDYRVKGHRKFMTRPLSVDKLIRRFPLHLL